jgi:preprotein translocase subunit YajC
MKKISVIVFLIMNSSVFAQATQGPQSNPLFNFIPMILLFLVFYFLMFRPQQKKMKQEQEMLSKLSKGNEVYTKSGLIGTIYGLTDKVVTLDMGDGVKIKVVRSQIGGLADSILKDKSDK